MSSKSMVVSVLILACATSPTWAAEQRTGCNPPTAADQAWMDANLVRVTRVLPNRLALQRVAAERQTVQGLMAAPVTTIAAEDGAEIIGVKGAVVAAPAVSAAPNVTAASMAYPRAVDNSTEAWFPPISGQRGGSCASFSTTYYTMTSQVARLRGWNVKSDNIDAHKFSTRFTYNLINNGADNGSWITGAYDVMLTMGSATYQTVPYNVDDFVSWPTSAAIWRDALNYRMAQSGSIGGVDGEVGRANAKQMLADGYILNYATHVLDWQYTNLKNDPATTADDGFFAAGVPAVRIKVVTHSLRDENKGLSGHGMTIVGYNDDVWCDLNNNGVVDAGEKGAFRIANSWGEWEDGGFMWVSYDALKQVSGVTNGPSDVSPTVLRQGIFWNFTMYWMSARTSYTPSLVAEITATHAKRNQMYLGVGRGDGAAIVPTTTWAPAQLQGSGGALAFDGTSTPVAATFVIDCSDIVNTGSGNRWFASFKDNAANDAGTFQNVRFIDSGAVATTYGATNPSGGLPKSVDAATVYAYADNANSTNQAPVALGQNVRTVKGAPYSVVLAATDANGDTLSYSIVANPGHGSLSGNGANRLYTPDANYQGTDFFTFKANDTKVDSNTATVVIQIGTAGSGLMAEFFHIGNNGMIPDLSGRVADLTRVDSQINYVVDADFPSGYVNDFSIRHTGFLNIVTAGSYTLFVNSDDGSKLWLDGALLINNDGSHGMDEKFATLTLNAGYHALRVEFYQGGGGKGLIMKWSGPSIAKAVVPASVLFYPVAANNVAPVAQAQSINVFRNSTAPVAISLVATDANLDVLTYATTQPAHGTLFGLRPNVSYLPDPGYVGVDSFTFKANDGTADSNTATVSITVTIPLGAPAITVQPKNVCVPSGQSATFSVTATGDATLAYQWRKNGSAISGATSATYITPVISNSDNNTKFSVVVSNSLGSDMSQDVLLTTVTGPPGYIWCASEGGSFTLNGTCDVAYGANGKFIFLTGQTGTIAFNTTTFGSDPVPFVYKSGFYKVLAPVITTQPQNITVTTGQTATFQVTATGTGPLLYQWRKNGSINSANGPNAATYTTLPTTLLDNGAVITVVISNGIGSVTSAAVVLTVKNINYPPTVANAATATLAMDGKSADLTVLGADNEGEAALNYSWSLDTAAPAAVTYTLNSVNAAKNTTATFTQAGSYTFIVTITDAEGLSVISNVTMVVSDESFASAGGSDGGGGDSGGGGGGGCGLGSGLAGLAMALMALMRARLRQR